jgi:hypothetical protein
MKKRVELKVVGYYNNLVEVFEATKPAIFV